MISCAPVTGIGEVAPGDDLATLLTARAHLRDGDVVVVTSKVVSKAEGRVVTGDRSEMLPRETDRVVARRGQTTIVRTRHGLVMAAAGIDASNTAAGTLVLLPADPDASARQLRERLGADRGPNVAVLVSDTSGRAWRNGQTDIAVGAAGLEVLDDHAGREDGYGNSLAVTAPAIADELTGMADLATGKLSRCPAAVVRGVSHLVLPRGRHGPGAGALVRPEAQDLFGYGTREAVQHAVTRTGARGFGAPASAEQLAEALSVVVAGAEVVSPEGASVAALEGAREVWLRGPAGSGLDPVARERVEVVAFSLGWRVADVSGGPVPSRTPVRLLVDGP